ncbi:hypothetical protein PTKIN_Ptkin07bG0099600 [Pterospermum kingtungense]
MHEFVLDDSMLLLRKHGDQSHGFEEVVLCRIYATVKDDESNGSGQGCTEMPQNMRRSFEGVHDQNMSSASTAESSQRPLKRHLLSVMEQLQPNKRALVAETMTPVQQEQQQPSASHDVILQVPLIAEPLTQHLLPSSYHGHQEEPNMGASVASHVATPPPPDHLLPPLITLDNQRVPLTAEPLTQQPFPSSYDQQEQSSEQALIALPASTRTEIPSVHPVPDLTQPLATEEPLMQPVREQTLTELPLSFDPLSFAEALSQQWLSHHDLDYTDLDGDLIYHKFPYRYSP